MILLFSNLWNNGSFVRDIWLTDLTAALKGPIQTVREYTITKRVPKSSWLQIIYISVINLQM